MTKLKTLRSALRELPASSLQPISPSAGSFTDPRRLSRHQRGYGTAWDKLRAEILERDRWQCQACARERGAMHFVLATHVDHIVPKADGGTDDPGNLQSLCPPCHKAKTMAENAARRAGTW